MKKIIAFTLAVIMIMSFATVAFASNDFTDVSKSKYETAINELYELGIVNGYSKTKFGTNYTLTRAEACAMMVRALYGEKTIREVIDFDDVSYRDWFYEYVNTAVYYDIMHGHNASTFAPNDDITYDQFTTLVLNALGYNVPKLSGTWPENVERIANRLDLYDGISSYFKGDEAISRGEACQMIYNALDCQVVEYKNGRIVETDETLYELMGFDYDTDDSDDYIYAYGTITDLVDVCDLYHTSKSHYYIITIKNTDYIVKSAEELTVNDYIEIYTDTKSYNWNKDYIWHVSYVVKAVKPIEPATPDVKGTITYIGSEFDVPSYTVLEIEVKSDKDGSIETYFVDVNTLDDNISINDFISLSKVKTLTIDKEAIDIYKVF